MLDVRDGWPPVKVLSLSIQAWRTGGTAAAVTALVTTRQRATSAAANNVRFRRRVAIAERLFSPSARRRSTFGQTSVLSGAPASTYRSIAALMARSRGFTID